MREAVTGFERLPSSAPRIFLYTGNALNEMNSPGFLTLGLGKTASLYLLESVAQIYGAKGFK